ncbi:hypothetical protein [Propioniferax innocua]|uniref:Uncharacterized protein n=1 Tax=Propioniferax innocua TaxID=1753 RepID=A0A542ZDG9_9ACTN|nr:hypothetical protein [Propioniferax innocua]TQL58394.1 hypothetical protein FB460_2255 [Propioniferax innocua]
MNEETEADRFVRQLLADEPHEKMPENVFQRLDAVVRAEAEGRAQGECAEREERRRIDAAKRTSLGTFGVNPVDGNDSLAHKKSLAEVRRVLRRH